MNDDTTQQIAIRVDKGLVRDFDIYARRSFRTRSDQLRSLMVAYVKESKAEEFQQRQEST